MQNSLIRFRLTIMFANLPKFFFFESCTDETTVIMVVHFVMT